MFFVDTIPLLFDSTDSQLRAHCVFDGLFRLEDKIRQELSKVDGAPSKIDLCVIEQQLPPTRGLWSVNLLIQEGALGGFMKGKFGAEIHAVHTATLKSYYNLEAQGSNWANKKAARKLVDKLFMDSKDSHSSEALMMAVMGAQEGLADEGKRKLLQDSKRPRKRVKKAVPCNRRGS